MAHLAVDPRNPTTPRDSYDGTYIWVINFFEETVSKINPATDTRIDYPTGAQPRGIEFDGTSIWITNGHDGTVSRMDPATGTTTDYPTGAEPRGIEFDGTSIWITNSGDSTVSRMVRGEFLGSVRSDQP